MIKKIVVVSLLVLGSYIHAGFYETGDFVSYKKRVSLRAVENQTLNSSFQLFYSNSESLGLVGPESIFLFPPFEMLWQVHELFCIKCVKGSFLPIYFKDEGRVGGQAPEGFHGPYYMSMWLNYPDAPEEQKQYVRYVVKNNHQGEFCIRINPAGDCQIIVLSNMQLLP